MPGLALSDTQNRYLALAWLCVDVEPKVSTPIRTTEDCPEVCRIPAVIDYEKFSQLTGSKTANSAREMLRVTKKKLLEFDTTITADGTVAPPNTPTVKTPRKKATSKTKSTKGKTNKKRKVASDSDDSEDNEETPIKKKTVIKNEPVDEDSEAGATAGADAEDAEV
ncbi:unnamed protein product [Aureobasidium mustum]|uniref:Uncharacterized protein n=1 Tax=Aureobasidium mustum TaxID=2773714 RepID=A0A9N8JH59_9PEZI|nr:unnamed protein product [Aureobasidium mustum]